MRKLPGLDEWSVALLESNGFKDILTSHALISELLNICYESVEDPWVLQYPSSRYLWSHLGRWEDGSHITERLAYIAAKALLGIANGGTDFYLTDEEEDLILLVLSPE